MKTHVSSSPFRQEKTYFTPSFEMISVPHEDVLTSSLPFARGNELPYRSFGTYIGSGFLEDDSDFLR